MTAPKAFTRDLAAPGSTFDPHGGREYARQLEWRGGNARFIGPVADPLWLWLTAGCPCVPASIEAATRLALARRAEAF